MSRTLPLLLVLAALTPESPEPQWTQELASRRGWEAEHRLPDGTRIDLLSPAMAMEVEWCSSKVYEAVGQALYYRASTGRPGGVVLLMGREPLKTELVWYLRCLVMCREAGLSLEVVDVSQ